MFYNPSNRARRPVSRVLSRPCTHVGGDGHSSRTPVTGRLMQPTRAATRRSRLAPETSRDARRSYLVLLPVGFSLPPPLPATRCALTAPFHPYRPLSLPETGRRCTFCGTFPGVAPAGRYPAPHLRGARTFLFPRAAESGHPAVWYHGIWGPPLCLSKADGSSDMSRSEIDEKSRSALCGEDRLL